jgi:hypothetical protein
MAIIISADELKENFEGYSPDFAEEFHHISTVLADKKFSKELKRYLGQHVVLMNGGTASGKSEFIATQLEKSSLLIFDATLSTVLGARNKIREIQKRKKQPVVYAIIPRDLKRAYKAFLNRERKFSVLHFFRTHSESRKTVLWIAENKPEVRIQIFESFYLFQNNMQFDEEPFASRNELVAYLSQKQIEDADIIKAVRGKE